MEANSTNLTVNQYCGALDCPGPLGAKLKKPAMSKVYTLCGVYLGLAVFSILITVFLLNTYKRKDKETQKTQTQGCKDHLRMLVQTLKHLLKPYQLLIIPLTLWLGFVQAFIGADFTKVRFFLFYVLLFFH